MRTTEVFALQEALMQLTQSGVLTSTKGHSGSLPNDAMQAAWVRATIAVRLNATLRGHSAVSFPVLEALKGLLEARLVPVVPLRGSVSASGDLTPLAYIAGAIQGNPRISVLDSVSGEIMPADVALHRIKQTPVLLGPKEGLGLVNGTAASAAVGALVMHHANHLAVLTQALSSMAVEALCGSAESFHPFIAAVRPHPGQIECAENVRRLLQGSRLATDLNTPKNYRRDDMIQDRYALRSTTQWLGPGLEDLALANAQITTELNSSCDNPLINPESGEILYGCNFQAASVTSAMEKTRNALQMAGRLLSAQLAEMVDARLSNGLPAHLVPDDPSLSFGFKGVDINMAAYLAELAFLAAPVSPFVQAAELHNQSVNSMALVSARVSMQAVDVLTLMCAVSLYTGCQALDLRVLHRTFLERVEASVEPVTAQWLVPQLQTILRDHWAASWSSTGTLDLRPRCEHLVDSAIPKILSSLTQGCISVPTGNVSAWRDAAIDAIWRTWVKTWKEFKAAPSTASYLGTGSRVLYEYVRQELSVPFFQGYVEHPTAISLQLDGRPKRTIGEWISIVAEAIRDGRVPNILFGKLQDILVENDVFIEQ
ncbi:hypothetical protein ACHAPV_010279 [Trichoderma viride]